MSWADQLELIYQAVDLTQKRLVCWMCSKEVVPGFISRCLDVVMPSFVSRDGDEYIGKLYEVSRRKMTSIGSSPSNGWRRLWYGDSVRGEHTRLSGNSCEEREHIDWRKVRKDRIGLVAGKGEEVLGRRNYR